MTFASSQPVEASGRGRGRRSRRFASVALLTLAGLTAAACGSDDDDAGGTTAPQATSGTSAGSTVPAGSTTTAAPADINPDGVLRIGLSLVIPGGTHLDPAESVNLADRTYITMIFGTLLRAKEDGTLEPWMAESYKVVNSTTVQLTIRDGIKFTDGAIYDAAAVRAGLLRTLNTTTAAAQANQLRAFRQIADVTASGRDVTITLKTPVAGEFVGTLAETFGAIVSPKQAAEDPAGVNNKPAGAGPFGTVVNYTPQAQIEVAKNKDFFEKDRWRLGGVRWIHTDPANRTNGLLAGTLDVVSAASTTDLDAIKGNNQYGSLSAFSDVSISQLRICSTKPPFDDVNVRKALAMAIDRKAVSDLVFNGAAKPAYGWWLEGTPNYNDKLKGMVEYNPAEAKRLLGGRTIEFNLYLTPIADAARIAEVMQSSMAEAGFKVTISNPRDIVAEVLTPQAPGVYLSGNIRAGLEKYRAVFTPGSLQAYCNSGRPEIISLLEPVAALDPGDPKVAAAMKQADQIIAEQGYLTPIVFVPRFTTWSNRRVGGKFADYNPFGLQLDSLYIKK